MCAVFVFSVYMQECRKALKSGEAQRFNMADMYGKNVIPMEKLKNLRPSGLPSSYAYVYMHSLYIYVHT